MLDELRTVIGACIATILFQSSPSLAAPAPKDNKPADPGLFGIIVDASGFKPGDAVDVFQSFAEWNDWRWKTSVVVRNVEVIAVESERSLADGKLRYFVLLRVEPNIRSALKSAAECGFISLRHHQRIDSLESKLSLWQMAGNYVDDVLGSNW
jgi:hypothetical protein